MIRRDDIKALQRAIEALPDKVSRNDVAHAIADVIAAGNPKFKREAFVKEPRKAAVIPSPFSPEMDARLAAIMDED